MYKYNKKEHDKPKLQYNENFKKPFPLLIVDYNTLFSYCSAQPTCFFIALEKKLVWQKSSMEILTLFNQYICRHHRRGSDRPTSSHPCNSLLNLEPKKSTLQALVSKNGCQIN